MTTEASPAADTTEVLDPTVALPLEGVDTSQTDATAGSSTADTSDAKAELPQDLASVIRDVVKPEEKPAASSATTGEEAAKPAAATATEGETEAEVPFHNHPRWKQVIAERDEMRPQAEGFRKITDFMQASSLTGPEVEEGFQIMAMLKSGDPASLSSAREWFATRLQALDTHLGHTLPADLQTKVDDGLIDEGLARELAQTRAREAMLQGQNTVREQRTTEERQAQETQRATLAMATAVNGWEATIKATDPDYATKAPMVEQAARAIVQRTGRPPTNAEEGIALAKAAYEEVNRQLKPFAPQRRPISPPATGVSARVSAAPTTLKEAVRLALHK